MEEIENQIKLISEQQVSIIEIRLDGLNKIDYEKLAGIIDRQTLPIILTLRSEWKDVMIEPPAIGRKFILSKLIELKPKYIDLEYPHDINLMKLVRDETRVVLSLLDFHGVAKISMEAALDLAKKYENVIIKISATPNSIEDLKLLWKWSKQMSKLGIPNIIVGMGELGKITRIKSLELKNLWMYGRVEHVIGEPFMPGMLPVSMLTKAFSEDSWHFAIIDNNEKIEADIHTPVVNAVITETELMGVVCDIPINNRVDLGQLLLWVNDGLLDGVQVSHPWQTEVISHLDELDYSANVTNQVNFIVPTKNGLKGYNTQVEAIRRVLFPYSKKRLRRVYIEGEKNYIKSLIIGLKDFADLIVLRGVNEESVKNIIYEYPEVISSEDSFTDTFDLVINNLSPEIGFERISPIPPVILQNSQIVFDPISSIFTSSATMKKAQKLGKSIIGSWEFMINSIVSGFELWTKQSIPIQSLSVSNIFPSSYFSRNFNWPLYTGYT